MSSFANGTLREIKCERDRYTPAGNPRQLWLPIVKLALPKKPPITWYSLRAIANSAVKSAL